MTCTVPYTDSEFPTAPCSECRHKLSTCEHAWRYSIAASARCPAGMYNMYRGRACGQAAHIDC